MAGGRLKFYLDAAASGANRGLTLRKKTKAEFVQQTVSFVDRTDAGWTPPTDIVSKRVATHNGTMFVSDPLTEPSQFNGLFSGRLDFTVNKMDMDLNVALYELLASGEYVRLFSPGYEFRASYVRDRVHRHLLRAGERQALTFRSERMTSRQLQTGRPAGLGSRRQQAAGSRDQLRYGERRERGIHRRRQSSSENTVV